MKRVFLPLVGLCLLTGVGCGSWLHDLDDGQTRALHGLQDSPAEEDQDLDVGGGWTLMLSPPSDLYPRYLADPRAPRFATMLTQAATSEIPQTADTRLSTAIGGYYGLLRFHPRQRFDRGYQLGVSAAMFHQWDLEADEDNIAWDGMLSGDVQWQPRDWFSMRAGIVHLSAHIGDEYEVRTGALRLDYLRDEVVIGLSLFLHPNGRFYAEAGYASPAWDFMEPWRVQTGLEFVSRPFFLGRHGSYFAAVDAQFWEESAWNPDVSLQTGLMVAFPKQGRMYRIGIQYYDGRTRVRNFFQLDERYLEIGFWFDL